jgi:hypothetical protein
MRKNQQFSMNFDKLKKYGKPLCNLRMLLENKYIVNSLIYPKNEIQNINIKY